MGTRIGVAAIGISAAIGLTLTLGVPGVLLNLPIVRETAPTATAEAIITGSLEQIGTAYAPGYFDIDYPGGDLPNDQGVCTDVVIRALRKAGYDLQQLIHNDMRENFDKYPKRYGLSKPDSNIDHRRVPNQIVFMQRFAQSFTTQATDPYKWLPGDIVYWKMPNNLDHCGIISNRRNSSGLPFVIHNAGSCDEEDVLDRWEIIGHFRYSKH